LKKEQRKIFYSLFYSGREKNGYDRYKHALRQEEENERVEERERERERERETKERKEIKR